MAFIKNMKLTTDRVIKPVFKLHQLNDDYRYLPLPAPTGKYPYHLNLQDVISGLNEQKIVFHMVGDTGSPDNTANIKQIAVEMAKQYQVKSEDRPGFLFHLGDIVYHHGEAERYDAQFFTPFNEYPGPIFAITGNHDSDVNPDSLIDYQSLDAFTRVFCDTTSKPVDFSGGNGRKSMIQPNVYWTLKMPLANIIGLHSNIPKYGIITDEQRKWFLDELVAANLERSAKALLVCLHHAPFSADTNHGSSMPMIEFLEDAFEETGIKPDMVFSGHVHNYQRFNKLYPDGKIIPYIVAGAGGFNELNSLAFPGDSRFTNINPLFNNVQLEAYRDNQHGFLKVSIEKKEEGLCLTGEYYALSHVKGKSNEMVTSLADSFSMVLNIEVRKN